MFMPDMPCQACSRHLLGRVGDCGLLAQCLDDLAAKHPGTKFVKIISTDCIPKYPDQNLPTVLLYRNTQLKQHLVGLPLYGGRNTTPAGEGCKQAHDLACWAASDMAASRDQLA